MMQILLIILQFFTAFSIFNVWVLRYRTMADDFRQFGFPSWFRNVIGGIKIFLALMLIAGIWMYQYAVIASIGIAVLMASALFVHLKEKDPFSKLWPALVLTIVSIILAVLVNHYRFVG